MWQGDRNKMSDKKTNKMHKQDFKTLATEINFIVGDPGMEFEITIKRCDKAHFIPKSVVHKLGDKIISGIIHTFRKIGGIEPNLVTKRKEVKDN